MSINNAEIAGVNKSSHKITKKEWDKVVNVNVKGVFFCTKHVMPYIQEAGSESIMPAFPIYNFIGAVDISPCHASKDGVRLMAKNDAFHYAKDNIWINSVDPVCIGMPLVDDLGSGSPEGVRAFRKYLDSIHAIRHVGENRKI